MWREWGRECMIGGSGAGEHMWRREWGRGGSVCVWREGAGSVRVEGGGRECVCRGSGAGGRGHTTLALLFLPKQKCLLTF